MCTAATDGANRVCPIGVCNHHQERACACKREKETMRVRVCMRERARESAGTRERDNGSKLAPERAHKRERARESERASESVYGRLCVCV